MEILYVTGWGFLVCSSCSQLEGLCSSPECNERTSLERCGSTWKSLHLYPLKQLLNNPLLCSTLFFPSTLNLSIFFSTSFLFALALSPVAISSAGTNLTLGFLEHHVLPEANRLWEFRLLTIYQHSQWLAVPLQAHRPPVTWAFTHQMCLLASRRRSFLITGRNAWWSPSVVVYSIKFRYGCRAQSE